MASTQEQDPVTKLPKLSCAADYIHWRRRTYAYIRRQDFELLCFEDEPPARATSATRKKWLQAMIRAKTSIILSLGAGPLAQLSNLVDDDGSTAKELWDSVSRLYTTSNTQVVLNLQTELDQMRLKDDGNWEKHIETFNEILGKLASYDSPVSPTEKASKLIKTLPESFAPLAMFSEASDITYDRLLVVVAGELSRRRNVKGTSSQNPPHTSMGRRAPTGVATRIHKLRTDKSKNCCFVCGKPGHYASECWYRQENHNGNGARGRGIPYSNRGRGRGRGFFRGHRGYGRIFRGGSSSEFPRGGYQGWGQQSNPGSGWPLTNQGQLNGASMPSQNMSVEDQLAQAHLARDSAPPPYPSNHPQSGRGSTGAGHRPFGFMAKLKFRSSVAHVAEEKTTDALIDSGGTHHFFHSRKSFKEYERMNNEEVSSASGTSIIVGKGNVWIPLHGGMYIEAFHTPHFSSNILSVGMLTEDFNTLFTTDPPAFNDISTCFIMLKGSNRTVFSTPIDQGLYKMKIGPLLSFSDYELLCGNSFAKKGLLTDTRAKTNIDIALEWHYRTGHPSIQRYEKLAQIFHDVPYFPRRVLQTLFCAHCAVAKAKRAPILPTVLLTSRPLERIHLDITGPITPTSIGGSKYALGVIDDFTAKSDVLFLERKSDLALRIVGYVARAENVTGHRLLNVRLDRAGENSSTQLQDYCHQRGILLEYSPPYASQSNGMAERLMQELGMRSRVLLQTANLDNTLWAEAMNHGNWLKNRLPAEHIDGNIPILKWNSFTRVSFGKLPIFGQQGYAFIYTSPTTPNRKLSARAIRAHFVGMHSDETLLRLYSPEEKRILFTRVQDFRVIPEDKLPSISTLLDGISKESAAEVNNDGSAEEMLVKAFSCFRIPLAYAYPTKLDKRLPRSFSEAIQDKLWCQAIDREYHALVKRNTWTYVHREDHMLPLPYTWVFRLKPLDHDDINHLHKARCCVRGDLQEARFDYDPEATYAPVASHESIRLLLAIAARDGLLVEGGDVCNAYLYGDIDADVVIEQPTDSSGMEAMPGMVCKLLKSMYGLKQAGNIWGSLLCATLLLWGFTQSTVDSRVFFKQVDDMFVIIVIVVDDLKFVSNAPTMLEYLKAKLRATFDVKLFGTLKSFIGWEIQQTNQGIKISQSRYTSELLTKYGLGHANGAFTPLPSQADLCSKHDDEDLLSNVDHRKYRTIIGELLYLAVCTRPDISFSVSVLARQVHNPTSRHLVLVKRLLRYIAGTKSQGILYPCGSNNNSQASLSAYVDADWAGCTESRHSTTGYVVTLGTSPICWKSRRQTVVALSSAESEYIALSSCGKELTWLRQLHFELLYRQPSTTLKGSQGATVMYVDNTAAISLAKKENVSARNKHIDIKYHHVRGLLRKNTLELQYVRSSEQLADMLTKPIDLKTLLRHRKALHLC